ncbi:MAG: hypothetical protein GY795_35710 [Desulfobacterales bacterium]|nr:hypothetical protein [Desulfobacterales bacterium]
MSENLPKNWILSQIGELCDLINGKAFKPTDWSKKGLPIIRIQNLNNPNASYNYYEENVHEKFLIQSGQLLFAWSGTPGTSFGAHIWKGGNAILNQHIFKVVFNESLIDKTFYMYAINQKLDELISRAHGGVGLRHITKKKFEQTQISLPPLSEQKRIAAKLDSLLPKVDACKARLDKVSEIIKRFRQSVLAAATSGKLTEDWREENPDVNGVTELLKKNQIYRESIYKEAVIKAQSQGKKKPNPFKMNHNEINTEESAYIPKTWKTERLVNISHIQGGVTKGRRLKGKDTIYLPYLRVANVQDGFLCLDEIKEIEVLIEEKDKYRLEFGDILFTEGGDRDKLGRGTIWRDEIKNCIYQNHIFRARLYCPDIFPEYISIATKSDAARKYFFDNASQTVNLASINMTTLGNVPVALPPNQEQKEIIRRVETLFSIADQLQEKLNTAKSKVEKLTPSILAKAFRGELVPQDPDDEPAELLLQRIRAERESFTAKTKKGRQKKEGSEYKKTRKP